MNKKCILNESKICEDCGNCLKCDLNKTKICDNCGKCLENEGVDINAIRIEDIAKTIDENEVVEEVLEEVAKIDLEEKESYEDEEYILEDAEKSIEAKLINNDFEGEEYEDAWDHLEYIDDLQDLLSSKDLEELSEEEFPGLIRIKKRD